MRFRNPKTGAEFYPAIVGMKESGFCEGVDCKTCPIDMIVKKNESISSCEAFTRMFPQRAAYLFGYELIDEPEIIVKAEGNKPKLNLVPLEALIPLARVREFALKKYKKEGMEQWRDISEDRLFAALLRHAEAYQRGEVDEESGLPAAYHMAMNAVFIAIKVMEKANEVHNHS